MPLLFTNFFNYPEFFCVLLSIFISYCGMIFGVQNLIRTFVSMEVIFLSLSFLFVITSFIVASEATCQVLALFVLALAACESALGLSLIIVFFRARGLLTSFEALSSLKG